MCESWNIRGTGNKNQLLDRVAKHLHNASQEEEHLKARIDCVIGKASRSGTPASVRRFYTESYKALDKFDRLWYDMRFLDHPHDWKSYFAWSLIHCALINARAVWCVQKDLRVSMIDFLTEVATSWISNVDMI